MNHRNKTPMVLIGIMVVAVVLSYAWARGIGLLSLPDGFFYYNTGQLLLYHTSTGVGPFNFEIPQTIYGPVYSIIVASVLYHERGFGMWTIPFFQLLCLFATAGIIARLTIILLGKTWQWIAPLICIALPFQFVYATSLMSETLTLFLFSLFCLFSVLLLERKTSLPPSLLVLLACILTLTKNAYLPLLLISFCFWILLFLRDRTKKTTMQILFESIPLVLGIIGIAYWMNFNHTHHHIWALTNYTGRHLYNNVVHEGKLLPPQDSAIYKRFRKKMSHDSDIFLPEWEVARVFQGEFNNKTLTESQIDKLFLTFSLETITHQPLQYLKNIARVTWGNLTRAPYHTHILLQLGFVDPDCPNCPPVTTMQGCRFIWAPQSCRISWTHPMAKQILATLTLFNRTLYPHVMGVVASIAIIGIIRSFFSRKLPLIYCSFLFLFMLLIQSSAQRIEGRYLIPLYGLYAICITNGFLGIYTTYGRIKNKLSKQPNTHRS